MDNNNKKYRAMYIFTYAPIGIICPLIGQYLSSIGFSGTQIGTVTAVSTAMAILASTFWGKIYSNSPKGKLVIATLCFAAAAMAMVCSLTESFILFTIMYGVLYFFQGPIMGLSDAMVLSDAKMDANFSSIRLFGAIGYAVATFIASKVGQAAGLDKIFPMYMVVFIVGGIVALTVRQGGRVVSMRNAEGSGHVDKPSGPNKVGFAQLLHEPKAVQLIICGFFIFGTNVANNTYFGFLVTNGGGTVAFIGIVFLLMVFSEAPFMAITPWVSDRLTPQRLIAVAIAIAILRFGWYFTGPSHIALLVTFFLQGMVNGVILVEYVRYISVAVDEKLIGIAVSLFYAISSNGGTIMCTFIGGILMDHVGVTGVYGFFAIMNAIGLVLYFIFGLQKPVSKKQ